MEKKKALQACREKVDIRRFCYAQSNKDKGGEECLIEELEEKRCLASHLCRKEADAFYGGVCSKWAESFAYTNDSESNSVRQEHEVGRAYVNADKRKIAGCRTISMDLAKCLSKYSPFDK